MAFLRTAKIRSSSAFVGPGSEREACLFLSGRSHSAEPAFCPEPLVVFGSSCKSSAKAAEPPGQAGWRKASPLGLPQGSSGFCTTPWVLRRRRSSPETSVSSQYALA